MSSDDSRLPDAHLEIGGLRIEPGDRLGPYIYRRVVGKGAMAHVALAHDPNGRPVALKILKINRMGSGLVRFKREFRSLARLRHPNVIRVDAYGDLHGHPYIAMEYVEGIDLHASIHTYAVLHPEERWRRCEAVLIDLCRALAYIHRRGLVHRDLKPSNVLIDADGRAKLTDFGIVKELDPNHDIQLSTTLVGTWAYASIEQMSGLPIDHRSDLYSLGVILFAMLTGRRPYAANDLAGYLEVHRTQAPPAPRDVDPRVPDHLDAICRRLLRREPRDRFRSAQEILFRLEQVVERDASPSDLQAWVPGLVGREVEDGQLRGAVGALTRGEGAFVLVEGAEGVGKSRLLDVVVDQAGAMGFEVYRIPLESRETPLGPVLRLVDALARAAGDRAPPALARVVQSWSRPETAGVTREQLVDALVEGFEVLLEDGPQVLVVDDLHLAQSATLDALEVLRTRLADRALLLVGALQNDSMRGSGGAARGRHLQLQDRADLRITVPALTADGVRQVVESLVGPGRSAQALTDRLVRETEGNVLFVVLFLQSLLANGMIATAPEEGVSVVRFRLVADPDEIQSGHFDVPAGVRDVVRARLDPLPRANLAVVEALAVHGRDMDLDVLLDVLERDEDDVAPALDALAQVGIVRQTQSGAQALVAFTHAKFGDVLYRELDEDRRAELHRRVARALEERFANTPAAAEVVGEHYRSAGDAGKAWRYLSAAAVRMAERGMSGEAIGLVTRASEVEDGARVDLPPDVFAATAHALLLVRADVHAFRGEPAQARPAVEEAIGALAGLPEDAQLRARVAIGRVLRTLGELDRAERVVQEGLPRARLLHARDVVAEGLIVLAGVAWSRGQHELCESRAQEGLLLATGPQYASQRARLLLALTSVQATRGQLASAVSGLSEAQLLFKDLRMRHSRALALANLAEVLLGQGDLNAAWNHATEALEEARSVGHRVGEIAAHEIRGHAAVVVGAADVGRREFEASLGVARSIKAPLEGLNASMLLGRLALEANDPDRASVHLDEALACGAAGDAEHYLPLIQALRAQALGRRALGLPAGAEEAQRALKSIAWDACAVAEASLAQLPLMRRAQVTLDLARAFAILGDFDRALPLARAASHLASMRGFRLLTLDALAVAAFVTPDEDERARLTAEVADWVVEVTPCIPIAWHAGFRQRLGLPPDA